MTRSRYLSASVRRALAREARGRCCLCRELIIQGETDTSRLAGRLERHHIQYLSRGGSNSTANLVVVCANCHTDIHKNPADFPEELLRSTKAHWESLRGIVPRRVSYAEGLDPGKCFHVPFVLETYGLDYTVATPPKTTVASLRTMILTRIVRPIGEHDDNRDYIDGTGYVLVHRSGKLVPPHAQVGSIEFQDDPLTISSLVWKRIILDRGPPTPTDPGVFTV